ncbi:MAG: nucleoside-diphosphate sugar epimerase/dehydratase [Anaerolineae bacterium]
MFDKKRLRRLPGKVRRALPLATLDCLILILAYTTTYSVRAPTSFLQFGQNEVLFMALAVGVTVLALFITGGYNRLWARTSGHDVTVLLSGVIAASVVLVPVVFFWRPRPVPLSVVIVGNGLSLMGFVAVRYRSRVISGLAWRWRAVWRGEFPEDVRRVLIVGAGDAGQTTAWRLKHRRPNHDHHTYRVVGFVDDDPAKQQMFIEGCQVLGTRADIPRLVKQHQIDLIIVAIHNISGANFRDILSRCEQTDARIQLVPDIFAQMDARAGVPLLRDITPEDLLGRPTVSWHEGIDAAPVTGKVILVTGAAGSIGSELCRQLLQYQPVKLIMLDNNESGLHDLYVELCTAENCDVLVPYLADVTQRGSLIRLFETYRPQVIFHSAAYKHVPMLESHPDESVRVNIGGTQQVAGLARDYGAERFVLISTDKAVNPTNVMGASKRVCELLMHALAQQAGNHTLFTAVRFGNVLGSRGSVVPTFQRQIERGGPVTVTHREMKRYFMTIPEAVNLVIHAACLTKGGDLFMLQMGEEVRILELAERMIRMRGLRPGQDIPIVFTGVRPGEKMREELYADFETLIPTAHPSIVQLVSQRNGLHPANFSDRVNDLFVRGFPADRAPLAVLQDLIAAGEHEMEIHSA